MSLLQTSTHSARTDAQRGCLWGTFFGDASGFLVEKRNPRHCKAYALEEWEPWWQTHTPPARTRRGYSAGQTSDDSVFTALLHEQLLEGWDNASYWQRIQERVLTRGIVGMGKGTRDALERQRAGIPLPLCGTPRPSNGAIMRAAIIGPHSTQWEQAAHIGAEQALPSHRDPLCQDGAALLAVFAHFLAFHPLEPLQAWETACHRLSDGLCNPTREWIDRFPPLDLRLEAALQAFLDQTPPAAQADWDGISAYVLATLGWAVWCFLRCPKQYDPLMFHVLSGGGDTDTTAAIASALFGIRHPSFLPASLQWQLYC